MSAPPTPRDADGYRRTPSGGGPTIRADVIEVHIFRESPGPGRSRRIEFLQLLRARDPLADTWQPVMGHCEPSESATAAMLRELHEEVGLDAPAAQRDGSLLGLWALEQVHPFFVAAIDAVVLCPRFAAQVAPAWTPRLNAEHRDSRWVNAPDVARRFLWPGQKAACREILDEIAAPDALARERLRLHPPVV